MQLPNADQAVISPPKLRDYLLNPDHPENRGKARLFAALGYLQESWQVLEADIRSQHLNLEATRGHFSTYGDTFEIVGTLKGPRGSATIMTVWMIDSGLDIPRFLTAHGI